MSKKNDMLDNLLYVSASQAGRNELDEYENTDPEIVLSPQAKKRLMKRLDRETGSIHLGNYHPVRTVMKRVAVVALAVMAVGFAGVISVEAVRLTLWETAVEWYEDNIRILYVKDESISMPTEILSYREPHPAGDYTRYELSRSSHRYSLEFESGSRVVSYQQYLLQNHAGKMTDSYTEISEIKIGENDGFMTTYSENGEDCAMITWTDGAYLYRMSGNVSADELIAIAGTVH